MTKTKRGLIITCAVLAAIFALILGGRVLIGALLFPGPTTRITAYPKTLEAWSHTGLVDHFPKQVVAKARNVKMYASSSSFAQGADSFQLRMQLPLAEVQAIEARVRARAVRACPDQCSNQIEDPDFWSVPPLNADEEKQPHFPADFIVYALETNGEWNHPRGKGVAISKRRNEVVYWAQH